MSHKVIINGSDLNYFKTIVHDALNGNLGTVNAVEVTVDDNGRLMFGLNGYQSSRIGQVEGTIVALQDTRTTEQVMGDLQANDVRPSHAEGSGNPYANVPQEDSAEAAENLPDTERIRLLEHDVQWLKQVVSRAEGLLGVSLRGTPTT